MPDTDQPHIHYKAITMPENQKLTMGRFLWGSTGAYRGYLFLLLILSIGVVLDSIIWPTFFKFVVDIGSQIESPFSPEADKLIHLFLFGGFVWFFAAFCEQLLRGILAFQYPKLKAGIRNYVFSRVSRQDKSFFDDRFSGSLARKIVDLANSVNDIIVQTITQLFPSVLSLIGILMLSSLSHIYFTVLLSFWALLDLALRLGTAKKISQMSNRYADTRSDLFGQYNDSLSNHMSVRAFAHEKHEEQAIEAKQQVEIRHLTDMRWFQNKVNIVSDLLSFVLCYVVLIVLLIHLWQQGEITVGDMVLAIQSAWWLMFRVMAISDLLPALWERWGEGQQVIDLLNVPYTIRDKEGAGALQVRGGAVVFDDVTFAYNKNAGIFEGKSLQIKGGEKVGLVGPSGAGKSSFVNLILRLYDVDSGAIRIDGQDIRDVTQQSLRRNIAYIPQDPSLFQRSLLENIRYGRPEASDEEVFEAARQAKIHDFILSLKEGYGTLVGERGIKLSGGQRQRVAIARAILKDAPILLIDEGTSALDSVTEEEVQQSLYALMEGRTTIVIAHRLSTLKTMDRLLVMDQGKIIQDGSHKSLLRQKEGLYATLWHKQAGGFIGE